MMHIKILDNLNINETYSSEMEKFVSKHKNRIIKVTPVNYGSEITYKADNLDYWHFTEYMIEQKFEDDFLSKNRSSTKVDSLGNNQYLLKREIFNKEYSFIVRNQSELVSFLDANDQDFINFADNKQGVNNES